MKTGLCVVLGLAIAAVGLVGCGRSDPPPQSVAQSDRPVDSPVDAPRAGWGGSGGPDYDDPNRPGYGRGRGPCGRGYARGYGRGAGWGDGRGYGRGDARGYGAGRRYGRGYAEGCGRGYGDGYCGGYGRGRGYGRGGPYVDPRDVSSTPAP